MHIRVILLIAAETVMMKIITHKDMEDEEDAKKNHNRQYFPLLSSARDDHLPHELPCLYTVATSETAD